MKHETCEAISIPFRNPVGKQTFRCCSLLFRGSAVDHPGNSIPFLDVLNVGTDGECNAGGFGAEDNGFVGGPIPMGVLSGQHQ